MSRNFGGATTNNIRRTTSIISQIDPRPVSVSAWLYPFSRNDKGNGNSQWIFTNNYPDGNPRFGLAVAPSGGSDLLRMYSGGYTPGSTFTMALNTWLPIGLSWDASNNLVLYANGAAAGTGTPAIGGSSTNNGAALGTLENTLAGFQIDGRLAHFAVWNTILTAAEFAMLALGVRPRAMRPSNLALYLPLWATHTPEIDLAGGATWSVNGTVAAANEAPVVPFLRPRWAASPLIQVGGGGGGFTAAARRTMGMSRVGSRSLPLRFA